MGAPHYRERRPPSALEPWVECAWELRLDRRQPACAHRVVPDGCLDLVWTGDAGLQVVGPNTTAFMAPLLPGASAVGVRMHPGAAAGLLGVCVPGLRDARVGASALWGVQGEVLEDAVARAHSPQLRAALLLHWLVLRARGARPPDAVVGALTRRLMVASEPITSIARELGYGERHLRRRVLAEVGYGPKYLARVLRLRRTLAAARRDRGASLAELAYDGGYADQAHFCHECSALAGATPRALIAS